MSVHGRNQGILPDPRQPKDKHLAKIEAIFGHISYLTDDQKRQMAEQRRRLASTLKAVKTQSEPII